MSTTNDQHTTLLRRLSELTDRGSLSWSPSDTTNSFDVELPSGSVWVGPAGVPITDMIAGETGSIQMRVFDSDGQFLETIGEDDLAGEVGQAELDLLHRRVREQVLGIPEKINDLLQGLEEIADAS